MIPGLAETSSSLADIREQVIQIIVALALGGLATLRAYWQKRLAQKLSAAAIEGVERSTTTIAGTLAQTFGPEGMAALKKAGIDIDALRERLAKSVKDSIKSVSVAAGVEPAMAAQVAKVTTQPALAEEIKRSTSSKIACVDSEGNPVTK